MQMLKYSARSEETVPAKRPAHQYIYEQLRDQVLFGELAPGQAVTIQGIAEHLNAGMTPVREAIRRLISDGALNMMGNRRVIVPELSSHCVEELDFMRKTLEPELTRRAFFNIAPETLAQLQTEDDALNAAIEAGNTRAYLTHNYRFHAVLYTQAKSPIMMQTVDRLWLQFGPSLRVVCGRNGTMNLPDKHADLLDAIRRADRDTAERAIAEDVDQGMNQIREALKDGS